jgi:hypothetical protein
MEIEVSSKLNEVIELLENVHKDEKTQDEEMKKVIQKTSGRNLEEQKIKVFSEFLRSL